MPGCAHPMPFRKCYRAQNLHSKKGMFMDPNYHREENHGGDTRAQRCQALQASPMAETEIIHRAQRQDAAAFEWLYKLYSRRVYALSLRMLGNTSEAEDLTQEAFLQLFRKIHTFRGESAFSTWLYRVCANVVLMWLRKKGLMEIHLENTQEEKDSSREEISAPDLVLNGTIDRLILERA